MVDSRVDPPEIVTMIDTGTPPPIDAGEVDVAIPPPPDASSPMCDPQGPMVAVLRTASPDKVDTCAGSIAAHTFTHAICTCESLPPNALSTQSIDSSPGGLVSLGGAPVGSAGYDLPTRANIGGTLTVAGTARSTSGSLDVRGDFRLAGNATFSPLIVRRNAYFGSQVAYVGSINIAGILFLAPGAGDPVGLGMVNASAKVPLAFVVSDPCDCSNKLNIGAIVTEGNTKVDNVARNIDPAVLVNPTALTRVDLLCGRYRFDSIGGTGGVPVRVRIAGRTAVFVDKDVDLSGTDFQLTMDPGAELDLFIRGTVVFGSARLPDNAPPASIRIYVGASTDISLPNGLIGNLYAPSAAVNVGGTFVRGSVYAKALTGPTGIYATYDRAILAQGNKCAQPAKCDTCHSCNGGQACIGDVCGPCGRDEDCCAPQVCDPTTRTCGQLIVP
ncbi:MAG: hypothetical protein ABW133_18210 [Polyangiaceae bacterium]